MLYKTNSTVPTSVIYCNFGGTTVEIPKLAVLYANTIYIFKTFSNYILAFTLNICIGCFSCY